MSLATRATLNSHPSFIFGPLLQEPPMVAKILCYFYDSFIRFGIMGHKETFHP